MNRNKNIWVYMIIVGLILLGATIVIVNLSVILRGTNLPSNQFFIGTVATLGGGLLGVLAAYLLTNSAYKKRQRTETEQQEELLRLSHDKRDLQKQLDVLEEQHAMLEKQTRTVLWIMAAAEKIEDDPRLAFVILYQRLEVEIQGLISRVYSVDTPEDAAKQTFSLSYDFDFLAEHVTPDETKIILQMRDLRNRIVHGEISPEEITPEKVRNYLQEALYLAQVIARIKQDDET